MKQHLFFALIVLLLLLVMPLFGLGGQLKATFSPQPGQSIDAHAPQHTPQNTSSASSSKSPAPAKKTASKAGDGEVIAVMRSGSGQTEDMDIAEYLVGVVAAEMPASAHEEALKAQAVASYTYARHRMEVAGVKAISDSGASEQEYISREERERRWGEKFTLYEAKLQEAVAAVRGKRVTYEGRPIFAAFHSVSHGKTESAANYWGGTDHPYLQPAESPGDRLAPDYSKTVTFTSAEMQGFLQAAEKKRSDKLALGSEPAAWFGKPVRSESGMVQEIAVGGTAFSGRELRELLGLRSADFTVDYDEKEDAFAVTTRGHGHSVGMSQYGADFMARQGSDYAEILKHYYQGCEVG